MASRKRSKCYDRITNTNPVVTATHRPGQHTAISRKKKANKKKEEATDQYQGRMHDVANSVILQMETEMTARTNQRAGSRV